jgi:hypothetical protein
MKDGKKYRMWLLRFRVRKDGRRVENGVTVGSLADFPTKQDAWKEVGRLGVRTFVNKDQGPEITLMKVVSEYMNKVHGLEYDMSARDWKPFKDSSRAKTTTDGVKCYVKNCVMPQWAGHVADKSGNAISETGCTRCVMTKNLQGLRSPRSSRSSA